MTTPELTKWLRENSSGVYSPTAKAADLIDDLVKKFTKLDEPKYSGDMMMDSVLATQNPEFRAWVDSLPPTYWARYDLSAARIGWEAAGKFIQSNAKHIHSGAGQSKQIKTPRRWVARLVSLLDFESPNDIMTTEIMDKLYLEIGATTAARTRREIQALAVLKRVWLKLNCGIDNEPDSAIADSAWDCICNDMGCDAANQWCETETPDDE